MPAYQCIIVRVSHAKNDCREKSAGNLKKEKEIDVKEHAVEARRS